MKRLFLSVAIVFALALAANAQLTFTVNDLINLKRVADPQLSPDGRTVAFTIGVVNKEANRTLTQIFVMAADGSGQKQLTNGSSSSSGPRWSPDGKRIAYMSGGQIWTMKPDGGDKEKITNISTGAGGPVWSPDGQWIAFGSEVYPECNSDECNRIEDEKAEKSKVQAKVTDRLLFKHWVEWRNRKRSHVFIVPAKGGPARDMGVGRGGAAGRPQRLAAGGMAEARALAAREPLRRARARPARRRTRGRRSRRLHDARRRVRARAARRGRLPREPVRRARLARAPRLRQPPRAHRDRDRRDDARGAARRDRRALPGYPLAPSRFEPGARAPPHAPRRHAMNYSPPPGMGSAFGPGHTHGPGEEPPATMRQSRPVFRLQIPTA